MMCGTSIASSYVNPKQLSVMHSSDMVTLQTACFKQLMLLLSIVGCPVLLAGTSPIAPTCMHYSYSGTQ